MIEGNDPSYEAYETPAYPSMLYHRVLYGGPAENRTPTKGLQSPCAPIITTSPYDLLLILLYAASQGEIEFVSNSASLIRYHFTLDTKPAGLEVSSDS